MLVTPLGEIEIKIDKNPVPYDVEKVDTNRTCPELDGRYRIVIPFTPDGQKHEISCCIRNHKEDERDGIESGEMLELKNFYRDGCKVSIGMEGDSGYYYEGSKLIRIDTYDYDNEYEKNGVKYVILAETATSEYVFGVAWIDAVNEENDVQTWYGADPTLMNV